MNREKVTWRAETQRNGGASARFTSTAVDPVQGAAEQQWQGTVARRLVVLEEERRRRAREKSESGEASKGRSPRLEAPLFINGGRRSWGWIYCAHIPVTGGVMEVMGHNYPRLSRPMFFCSCNGAPDRAVIEAARGKVLKST
jgi:hypothetical protein